MSTIELAQHLSTSMAEHLTPRAVAIIVCNADDVPAEVGSGTCVQIADRYFIATAAHLFTEHTQLRKIGVLANGPVGMYSHQTPKLIGAGRRGGGDNDPVDVAWLELHPLAVQPWIERWGSVFVTLDRLSVEPIPVGTTAFVFGQPKDYLHMEPTKAPPSLGLKPLPFMTTTLPTPVDRPPQDLYVAFPRQVHTAQGATGAPRAFGLSGCGIWVIDERAGDVWAPEFAKLAAIQCSWRTFEWLRGTPIHEWLQLVRDDIPELAPEIDVILGRVDRAKMPLRGGR